MEVFAVLAALLVVGGIGYWAGWQHASMDAYDRLERINPSDRPPGTPTNLDAEPSRVSVSKFRNRRRWSA